MKKALIVVSLIAFLITGGVYALLHGGGSHAVAKPGPSRDLALDRYAVVDFGFQEVEEDFTAASEITLINRSTKNLRIIEVSKSCSCYALKLSPEDVVEAGQDVKISFRHAGVSAGKGGLFHDVIGLTLDDGERQGAFAVHYTGYVVQRARLVPRVVEFRNVDEGNWGRPQVVAVHLPKIVVTDGEVELVAGRKVARIECPPSVEAAVMRDLSPEVLRNLRPNVTVSKRLVQRMPAGIPTAEGLGRLVGERPALESDDLVESVAVAVRLREPPAGSFDGELFLVDDLGSRIPVPFQIRCQDAFAVAPRELAFYRTSSEKEAQVRLYCAPDKELDVTSIRVEHAAVRARIISSDRHSAVVGVTIPRPPSDDLVSNIVVETNLGVANIPVSYVH